MVLYPQSVAIKNYTFNISNLTRIIKGSDWLFQKAGLVGKVKVGMSGMQPDDGQFSYLSTG